MTRPRFRLRPAHIPMAGRLIRRLARIGAIAAPLGMVACVPQAPQPTPAPAPAPVVRRAPAPAPAATPEPAVANWIDAPQSPGDWRYAGQAASYGDGRATPGFTMRCDRARRQVALVRAGMPQGGGAAVPMRVLTETASRTLTAQAAGTAMPEIVATVPANDPLLDAMALSRGRFAVAVAGLPTLYLPSWAEVSRVVEDCR